MNIDTVLAVIKKRREAEEAQMRAKEAKEIERKNQEKTQKKEEQKNRDFLSKLQDKLHYHPIEQAEKLIEETANFPLQEAFLITVRECSIKLAEKLIDKGADAKQALFKIPIGDSDISEDTCIQMASMLLKKGADINARDANEVTPLCMAIRRNHSICWSNGHMARKYIAFLMEKGADPDKGNGENYPLLITAKKGDTEMALSLLKHGANPTRVNLNELFGDCEMINILEAACIVWEEEHRTTPKKIIHFLYTFGELIGIKNVGKNTRGKGSIPPSPVRDRF